ncbi:MAG: dihydrodipicolinate synthase family protein [Clostridia bacterium]|nr:dihydrodipicolinate synthase family protein [Clostridia bacterium]
MKNQVFPGAYPTMITPYNQDGTVDYGCVKALTEWYYRKGCDGIFAACQSSEIAYLSLADRVNLAKTVSETAKSLSQNGGRAMNVVASGHISYDKKEQIRELCLMARSDIDAVMLMTYRMDISGTGEDNWIKDTEYLMNALPDSVPLGAYECPLPYKRLMTDKMLSFCAGTGRFAFMKDTCCDSAVIRRRLEIIKGSPMKLLNANGQTLLETLRDGGHGYCGVMCNFHPELFVWLCHHFAEEPQKAELIQGFIGTAAFTEALAYPCTAKYHLSEIEGLPFKSLFARSRDQRELTDYHKSSIRQMHIGATYFVDMLKKSGEI